ncbi:hypothetical protein PTSG_10484 [Salpingoeca rosetta]|uniref:K Homology domain-containing protein n=1 Tax=Salpingoeca rosetta (strain ATCC 50818 / BSB-021) TaxID=946362 RepID=F2UPT1_SALR5|nr:uncharacterized protein PTSG_10484 [Salpingoeca rosetta]EGD79636.1 hypothetical protein PTSG_10484 [Salpingoeca rosetta]|eukprot:XP_004988864.1 hypothetical protein PTSG_10484 [Salpingoeca rosetta]
MTSRQPVQPHQQQQQQQQDAQQATMPHQRPQHQHGGRHHHHNHHHNHHHHKHSRGVPHAIPDVPPIQLVFHRVGEDEAATATATATTPADTASKAGRAAATAPPTAGEDGSGGRGGVGDKASDNAAVYIELKRPNEDIFRPPPPHCVHQVPGLNGEQDCYRLHGPSVNQVKADFFKWAIKHCTPPSLLVKFLKAVGVLHEDVPEAAGVSLRADLISALRYNQCIITIHKNDIGRVIGRDGHHIFAFQQLSGGNMYIPSKPKPDEDAVELVILAPNARTVTYCEALVNMMLTPISQGGVKPDDDEAQGVQESSAAYRVLHMCDNEFRQLFQGLKRPMSAIQIAVKRTATTVSAFGHVPNTHAQQVVLAGPACNNLLEELAQLIRRDRHGKSKKPAMMEIAVMHHTNPAVVLPLNKPYETRTPDSLPGPSGPIGVPPQFMPMQGTPMQPPFAVLDGGAPGSPMTTPGSGPHQAGPPPPPPHHQGMMGSPFAVPFAPPGMHVHPVPVSTMATGAPLMRSPGMGPAVAQVPLMPHSPMMQPGGPPGGPTPPYMMQQQQPPPQQHQQRPRHLRSVSSSTSQPGSPFTDRRSGGGAQQQLHPQQPQQQRAQGATSSPQQAMYAQQQQQQQQHHPVLLSPTQHPAQFQPQQFPPYHQQPPHVMGQQQQLPPSQQHQQQPPSGMPYTSTGAVVTTAQGGAPYGGYYGPPTPTTGPFNAMTPGSQPSFPSADGMGMGGVMYVHPQYSAQAQMFPIQCNNMLKRRLSYHFATLSAMVNDAFGSRLMWEQGADHLVLVTVPELVQPIMHQLYELPLPPVPTSHHHHHHGGSSGRHSRWSSEGDEDTHPHAHHRTAGTQQQQQSQQQQQHQHQHQHQHQPQQQQQQQQPTGKNGGKSAARTRDVEGAVRVPEQQQVKTQQPTTTMTPTSTNGGGVAASASTSTTPSTGASSATPSSSSRSQRPPSVSGAKGGNAPNGVVCGAGMTQTQHADKENATRSSRSSRPSSASSHGVGTLSMDRLTLSGPTTPKGTHAMTLPPPPGMTTPPHPH